MKTLEESVATQTPTQPITRSPGGRPTGKLFPKSPRWRGIPGRRDLSDSRDASLLQPEVRAADRREHRRMGIELPVEIRRLTQDGEPVRTITRNISTGGLFVELDQTQWTVGDRLFVRMTLPPEEGVSPYAGEASCEAEVVRADAKLASRPGHVGLGVRFLDRLKLSF